MTINLTLLRTGIGREGDLVFWIQCRGWYPAGRSTSVLEGIDNGGATNWSGLLPETGEYEIYVSNPPIRDHPIGRSLPYKLTITTKRMRRGSFSKFNPQTPHIQLAESKQKLNSKQITLKLNPELEP